MCLASTCRTDGPSELIVTDIDSAFRLLDDPCKRLKSSPAIRAFLEACLHVINATAHVHVAKAIHGDEVFAHRLYTRWIYDKWLVTIPLSWYGDNVISGQAQVPEQETTRAFVLLR